MAITEAEWTSISAMIERIVGHGGKDHFMSAVVIKRDEANGNVYVRELADQAIPVVAHSYKVKYYDTDQTGTVIVKNAVVSPVIPKVGEHIFIVFEMGERSLPRCVGVMQGRNWVSREDEAGEGDI